MFAHPYSVYLMSDGEAIDRGVFIMPLPDSSESPTNFIDSYPLSQVYTDPL